MRLFALLPPLLKRLEARRGTMYKYNVYTIYYICTAWIWTEISASRSTGKSVQGQLILITLPDLFDAPLEPETGISWEWELGIGLVCRRRWSVPCIQLETANTCWKCPCHAAAAAAAVAPKKTHLGSTVAQCCQLSQNMKIKRAGEGGFALSLSSGSAWLTLITVFFFSFFFCFRRSVIKCILL